MGAELLLDTGAFVALVDRSETRHADCVAVLENWLGAVVTTEAVLTETLHLVGPGWKAQEICLEFFLRGAFLLIPSSRQSLHRVTALMRKYQDVPMDFADATLVALGEELETDQVFTLDQRGFSVYRLHGKKPFRILPA
ncbi:MAG: PIN domain-containing protein [Anaerolineae bacterium]|nr:PIN domain-containing protein [Anaerolineae bacterium]MDW8100566.1 PIN domain-containing protein [Anaerolineae bacterium]